MTLVVLTRPDGSAVAINTSEVVLISSVPSGGGSAGPIDKGSRISFRNGAHQDVTEEFEAVVVALRE